MKKGITSVLTIIFLLCNFTTTVFAHDVPDFTKKGSITITMTSGDTYVKGGSLTLYKVGDIYEDDGNYSFKLSENFADSGEDLENLQSSQVAKNLANYALRHSISGVNKDIDQNTKVTFTELELGLYLIVQNKAANGYSKCSPFLISVPNHTNGVYIYNVDASPKVEIEPTTKPDIPDEPDNELPQTGQLNWPIPILVIGGLTFFIIGWWLNFGRKKEKYEK